jgi:hypothetical protein
MPDNIRWFGFDDGCMSEGERGLHYGEEFQSLATKWHPNKAEMNRLCALVEDKCGNQFKNILKKREVQLWTDFLLLF